MVGTQNTCGLHVASGPLVCELCSNYRGRQDDHVQAGWITGTTLQRTWDLGLALKDGRMQVAGEE